MNFKEILELIDKVAELGIGELEIEQAGTRLRIQGKPSPPPQVIHSFSDVQRAMNPIAAPHGAPQLPPKAEEEESEAGLHVINSPIVGTFYRSPEPGAPPFVEIGSQVKKGQVLCIIEAMKLMNEIDSEYDGEIVTVYAESGQPVQYGERLFAIRTT